MSYEYKNFTELDFERIRTSLIDYLKTQSAFEGFDFTGTAINALINLLAYNTQYNAFYLNMHASERFISTAQRRENVVSIAKNLGYSPHSPKGAVTEVNLSFSPVAETNPPSAIVLPKHTVLTCSNEDETFTLYTEESYTLSLNTTTNRYAGNVKVFEGKKFTQNFIMTTDQNGFVIPNKDVQTDKLLVIVTEGSISQEWIKSSDMSRSLEITQINGTQKIYFAEEVVGQKTRVYFGDGVIGKRPVDGASIQITYFTTSGALANGASDITYSGELPSGAKNPIVINPEAKLTSGVNIEDIDSIRANAPLLFAAQNRAVTPNDFKSIIQSKILPGVHSVSCWGGEEDVWNYIDVQGTPFAQQYVGEPKLGYVFISILEEPNDPTPFTSIETKLYVESTLRNKYGVVTIFPEVVQPRITFLAISTKVKYDSSKSVQAQELKENIRVSITQDQVENYSEFQTTLRYSRLSTAIDSSSPYIISNNLEVSLYTEASKEEMQSKELQVSIGVPISVWSLKSSEFEYTHEGVTRTVYLTDSLLPDDMVGLAYRDENNSVRWIQNNGSIIKFASIDRSTGTIDFYIPPSEPGAERTQTYLDFSKVNGITEVNKLRIYATSLEKDVSFTRNVAPILRLDDIKIELTAE